MISFPFEIKKDFSGYILDPLQIFKSKGSGNKPYIAEKSIIRPTFSYLGNFTISDTVFRQITEYIAKKQPSISKVIRTRVENYGEGPSIYIEVSLIYGCNVFDEVNKFKEKTIKESHAGTKCDRHFHLEEGDKVARQTTESLESKTRVYAGFEVFDLFFVMGYLMISYGLSVNIAFAVSFPNFFETTL